jgi:hypothetical protein
MSQRHTPAGAVAVTQPERRAPAEDRRGARPARRLPGPALLLAALGCAGGLSEAGPLSGLSPITPAAATLKADPAGSLAIEIELPAPRCLVAVAFLGGGPFTAEVTAGGAEVPGLGGIDLASSPPGLAVVFAEAPVEAPALTLTFRGSSASAPPPFELWGRAGDCEDAAFADPSTLRRAPLHLGDDSGA